MKALFSSRATKVRAKAARQGFVLFALFGLAVLILAQASPGHAAAKKAAATTASSASSQSKAASADKTPQPVENVSPAASAAPAASQAPAMTPHPAAASSGAAMRQATGQDGVEAAPLPGAQLTRLRSPARFDECVRVALAQSPILEKSSIEIDAKRLDVNDTRAQFIPTLIINTTYWFSQPPLSSKAAEDRRKPYSITFSSGAYNPIMTLFEIQAREEMVKIAIYSHMKVIGEGLLRLGTDFLQLAQFDELSKVNRENLEVARKNLEFVKTRMGMGQATPLDVRIADQQYSLLKIQDEQYSAQRSIIMDDVKFLLGIPFSDKITLDYSKAIEQVLDNFSPTDIRDDKIRKNAFELRIADIERKLQDKNIAVSYVKLLPTFNFVFQTVDPINTTAAAAKNDLQFYPGITMSLPLDWWTKSRDVNRQYQKKSQLDATVKTKEFQVSSNVQTALSKLSKANADLRAAKAKEDLAVLQAQLADARYKAGTADFDAVVNEQKNLISQRETTIFSEYQRAIAMLNLRHAAGDLQENYISTTIKE